MKKIIVAILVIAILTGVGFGIYGIVKAVKANDSGNGKNITYKVELIEDEYTIGEKVIFRVLATSDIQLTSLRYSINNGEETELTVTAGDSSDFEAAIGKGKYFIDSGAEIIETTAKTAGYYTLVVYGYDADETRYEITKDPIVFRLRAATVAE